MRIAASHVVVIAVVATADLLDQVAQGLFVPEPDNPEPATHCR